MARTSNIVIGIINTLSLLAGVAAVVISIQYHTNSQPTDCQKSLQYPLLISGLILIGLSLLGLIGAISRSGTCLLGIYMSFISLLFFALLGFAVFAIVVTSPGLERGVSKVGFRKYSLLNRVYNEKRWGMVRSCLADSNICRPRGEDDDHDYLKIVDKNRYSALKFGCCQKPTDCKSGDQKDNTDCNLWSKDPNVQCYYCNSCKNGFFETVTKQWKIFTLLNMSGIVFVIIVFFFASCAKRNNRKGKAFRYVRHRQEVDRRV